MKKLSLFSVVALSAFSLTAQAEQLTVTCELASKHAGSQVVLKNNADELLDSIAISPALQSDAVDACNRAVSALVCEYVSHSLDDSDSCRGRSEHRNHGGYELVDYSMEGHRHGGTVRESFRSGTKCIGKIMKAGVAAVENLFETDEEEEEATQLRTEINKTPSNKTPNRE